VKLRRCGCLSSIATSRLHCVGATQFPPPVAQESGLAWSLKAPTVHAPELSGELRRLQKRALAKSASPVDPPWSGPQRKVAGAPMPITTFAKLARGLSIEPCACTLANHGPKLDSHSL